MNELYRSQKLVDQALLLLPQADAIATLDEVTEEQIDLINQLEPFGNGNPQPIIRSDGLLVKNIRKMGSDSQHIKLELQDRAGCTMQFLAFNSSEKYLVEIGDKVSVWYQPDINEWQGRRTIEGRLLHLEIKE